MSLSHFLKLRVVLVAAILGFASVSSGQIIRDGQKVPKLKKVFVLSNGGPTHWHETVAQGAELVKYFGLGNNPDSHSFEVFDTPSPADITAANLKGVQCLVMNNVSGVGVLLNASQKAVIQAFITAGGGTAGWHATTDTGGPGSWPWFINWISTTYVGSANWVPATMTRSTLSHDAKYADIMGKIPDSFLMESEEWYQYANPAPEDNVNNKVLLSVDPKMVSSTHKTLPYVWINDSEMGGRFWESGFGHLQTILARADVQEMIYRGITWAGGGWDLAGCMTKAATNYNSAATVACTNCCQGVTGIEIQSNSELHAKDVDFSEKLAVDFSVTINGAGKHTIRIYDVGGKLVAMKQNNHPMRYEFPEVAKAGIYFVKVTTANKTVTKRVERF